MIPDVTCRCGNPCTGDWTAQYVDGEFVPTCTDCTEGTTTND